MEVAAFQEQGIKFISKRTSKSHLHTLKSFHVYFNNSNTHKRTKVEIAPDCCPDFKAYMCSEQMWRECVPSFCWTRAFHVCVLSPQKHPHNARNYWLCWTINMCFLQLRKTVASQIRCFAFWRRESRLKKQCACVCVFRFCFQTWVSVPLLWITKHIIK